MDHRISETFRYILLVALAGTATLFGWQFLRKLRDNNHRIDELRTLSARSSFCRQFYPDAANRTLLTAMADLRECELDGLTPLNTLDKCFHAPSNAVSMMSSQRPADEALVRATLLDNYENCRKLGLFAKREATSQLRHGSLPNITNGPAAGLTPVVGRIIDPSLAPGLDQVVANFEIRPPAEAHSLNEVERNAARQLARALAEADILAPETALHIQNTLESPAKKSP